MTTRDAPPVTISNNCSWTTPSCGNRTWRAAPSARAGSAGEFRQRHGEPASPERIAQWLRMSLQAWREDQCDGVVTYCLDKRSQSETFPLAQKLFREFRTNQR